MTVYVMVKLVEIQEIIHAKLKNFNTTEKKINFLDDSINSIKCMIDIIKTMKIEIETIKTPKIKKIMR